MSQPRHSHQRIPILPQYLEVRLQRCLLQVLVSQTEMLCSFLFRCLLTPSRAASKISSYWQISWSSAKLYKDKTTVKAATTALAFPPRMWEPGCSIERLASEPVADMLSLIDLLNKKVDSPPFQQDKRRSGKVSAFVRRGPWGFLVSRSYQYSHPPIGQSRRAP